MEKIEIVENFLENFSSQNTIRGYRRSLHDYFNAINIQDPNTYFKQDRDYKQDVETFCKSLKNMAPKTFSYKFSAVKSFFDDYEETFPSFIVKKYQKRNIGANKPITRDQVFTKEQLKSILADSNVRGRAFFLLMASSGLRPGEARKITMNDIDLTHDPVKIRVRKEIAKNKQERITFISDEAKHYLEEWLKIRERHIESYKESIENMGNNAPSNIKKRDKRVFPFSQASAWKLLHRLLDHSNNINIVTKTQRNHKKNAFHLNSFRKFTRTNLPQAMPLDQVEEILGHEGYLTVYRQYPDYVLAESYKKAMHTVTLFDAPSDFAEVNEEIKDLKAENDRLKKQMDQMNQNMLNLLAQREIERKIKH